MSHRSSPEGVLDSAQLDIVSVAYGGILAPIDAQGWPTFNVFLINYPDLSNAQNTDYGTSPSQQKRTLTR